MKKLLTCCLAGVFAASVPLTLAACDKSSGQSAKTFSDADVTYSINGTASSDAKDQISDMLFGVFLEDINYASYAMDDNMVSNGSFEYTTPTKNWTASGLTLSTEQGEGVSSTNKTYAKLVLNSAGSSLANSGYAAVPITLTKDAEYTFSAFFRAVGYVGDVKVRIATKTATYAESTLHIEESNDWVKYQTVLKLNGESAPVSGLSLELVFESVGTLYLDAVQFETSDATGGIKNYMYDAIKELAPKFIRFPGGCVIEGRTMTDTYDWKNSIGVDEHDEVPAFTYTLKEDDKTTEVTTYGEVSTRTPNIDIWQQGTNYYMMEYGVGFYEYFLLCDNLGASAIPIVNCGISCMIQSGGIKLEGRYGNGIEDYIDEALDLVAFAKGDVNSTDANEKKWAQVRANMGHSEPFEMKYLGIGNEQWGGTYYSYYEQFIEAFEAAKKSNPSLYSDIELIVGNGTSFGNCEYANGSGGGTALAAARSYVKNEPISTYGVHDHHYYLNYADLFTNTTLYDKYSRDEATRYDVFVGEYSANAGSDRRGTAYPFKENNWMTALSEAAYMTGLERNGDVVKLAAYAPMFGCLNGNNQWPADMMFFTNTAVVFTPNYYVQQLFSVNQGSTVLATDTKFAEGFTSYYNLTNSKGEQGAEIDKLYQIVSKDSATGDIIIKLVNASEDNVKVNFDISSASLTGLADVTLLQNIDTTATSTAAAEAVTPFKYTLNVASQFGYEAKAYSVTAIRIHTK